MKGGARLLIYSAAATALSIAALALFDRAATVLRSLGPALGLGLYGGLIVGLAAWALLKPASDWFGTPRDAPPDPFKRPLDKHEGPAQSVERNEGLAPPRR